MELAIELDPLFEQVLIYGEGQPFLSALVVLNDTEAARTGLGKASDAAADDKTEKLLLPRIAQQIKNFPGYAQVRRVFLSPEKWTVDNGLMTPTLKLKRAAIFEKYRAAIDAMYKAHR